MSTAAAATDLAILLFSPVWMGVVGLVVATGMYERFDAEGYVALGVCLAAPCALLPWAARTDGALPLSRQDWLQCNVWIGTLVFSASWW